MDPMLIEYIMDIDNWDDKRDSTFLSNHMEKNYMVGTDLWTHIYASLKVKSKTNHMLMSKFMDSFKSTLNKDKYKFKLDNIKEYPDNIYLISFFLIKND